LIKNNFLKKIFSEDLPADFSGLKKPLNIGATNTNKGEYIIFNS